MKNLDRMDHPALPSLALLLLLGACSGARPNGSECAGATSEAAKACQSGSCIGLNANVQHKNGICTERCTGDCRFGGVCASGFPDGNNYCVVPCAKDGDCRDGFVCVVSNGNGICFVQAGGGGKADCSDKNKCIATMTDAAALQGYCQDQPASTQVCDCPGGSPGGVCKLSTTGAANVYCCP